jgi:hypothetical protein
MFYLYIVTNWVLHISNSWLAFYAAYLVARWTYRVAYRYLYLAVMLHILAGSMYGRAWVQCCQLADYSAA